MQKYDCQVRLAGNPLNEVPKCGVTAPEVLVIRELHGGDSVIGLQRTTMDKRSHRQERERLSELYGPSVIAKLFGSSEHMPLPVHVGDEPEPEPEPEEEAPAPKAKRGRPRKEAVVDQQENAGDEGAESAESPAEAA